MAADPVSAPAREPGAGTASARLRGAESHGRRFRPRRWSLRSRLLVVLVSLLALVCIAVGVLTALGLRGFLVGRLDSQLSAASGRSVSAGGQPGVKPTGSTGGGAQFATAPGQAAGTLGARIESGAVTDAGVVTASGSLQTLSAADKATLAALPVDGHPHTRVIAGRGKYRLQATSAPDRDVLVTGLPLSDVDHTVDRLVAVELAVSGAALLFAMGAGFLIVRRTLRPLRRVAATATRVSALPLERGEVALFERVAGADVDDRTEVGQVAGAVNRLLDHVGSALSARQASETRVRQFVADASHELRTPLAAIRGYAELTRRSRDQAPPDIAHAMARVESEAARMTSMVEDLLLLARLDEGRPLELEQVDLTHVLLDAVSDVSAAGRDHHWRLNLPDGADGTEGADGADGADAAADAAGAVSVRGDSARLHQVVVNLLANARTHTPPGTTVTAGLASSSPDTVTISVLDDGPGIAPDILPTVFERFARGGSARSGPVGSTGLGLAIVAAIVAAHDGTVHVDSRPGQTVFLVRLPVAGPGRERSVD